MNDVHEHQVSFVAPARATEEVQAACVSVAGGVTLLAGHGAWKNDAGNVETEPVVFGVVSVRDMISLERLRVALHDKLRSHREQCMWFTSQHISGGLFAVEDANPDRDQDGEQPGETRAVG